MGPDPGDRSPHRRHRTSKEITISRHQSTGSTGTGFDRFDLRPELRQAVAEAGFSEPRPIQARALPSALEGRDVLGLAQTGTGKTAAFVLPILQRLLTAGRSRRSGPSALVVAPTRELAAQVHAEFERLATHTPHTSLAVFGGVPIARQIRALARRPDVIVACPGRLLDLLGQRALSLDSVQVLVLDEADHMFDMGFLPDVRRILRALPEQRQNLMFSATMPPEIRRLADTVLRRPEVVELSHSKPAETIEHGILALAEGDKVSVLENVLAGDDFRSSIVFVRTKRRAKRLAERLDKRGHAAVALQGNMSQPQRERALLGFRNGHHDVLVATDIAARGLDIAGVSHVVNFDVPGTPDAYTHRIGRTGRSEQAGRAFTFATPADAAAVRQIEKRLGREIERWHVAGSQPPRRRKRQETRPESVESRSSSPARRPAPARTRPQPAARQEAQRPVVTATSFGEGVFRGTEKVSNGSAARANRGSRRRRRR